MAIREDVSEVVDNIMPHVPVIGPPVPMVLPAWPDGVKKVLGKTPLFVLSKKMLDGQAIIVNAIAGH